VSIPGVGDAALASSLKKNAGETMERQRLERIKAAQAKGEVVTEQEKLLFVRGIEPRTAELLAESGYRTVDDLMREEEERLATRSGLGARKARAIKNGLQIFFEQDAKTVAAIGRS
jgi:transcription termination/antitermination protein NusA